MSDTKLLQSILNGQASIREDIKRVEKKVDNGFEKVNTRINKLGLQISGLEDDSPTIEEFDNLEKRVERLEKQQIST